MQGFIVQKKDATGPLPDEFYDVTADPLEQNDLGVGHPDIARTRADYDSI